MSLDRKEICLNDTILFRTVSSGFSEDVARLFEMTDYKITSFSNHALNWSVIQACHMGHASLVQFLLQDNARLEVRDDSGNTPLLICSEKGLLELVSMLLSKGADVNAANNNGDTALFLANSPRVMQHLLNQRSIDVDYQNNQGYTALMSAIEGLHYTKISLLINAGACVDGETFFHQGRTSCCVYRVNKSGDSALKIAERAGIARFVEVLKQSRVLVCSPLVCTALNSDVELFDFLLHYGLCEAKELNQTEPNILNRFLRVLYRKDDVTRRDIEMFERVCNIVCDANTPAKPDQGEQIELAVEIGNYDLVEILCRRGVLLNHKSLEIAVLQKHTNMIPLLAFYGAPLNQVGKENGCHEYPGSALDQALSNADMGSAGLLLYHGAKINVQYALKKAVKTSCLETMKYLLDECPEEARSALETSHEIFHSSVANGDIDTIKVLLASGANVDGIFDDRTPLMVSVDIDVIHYLLRKGADVNLKTSKTALINVLTSRYLQGIRDIEDYSLTTKDSIEILLEIITLLLDYGADINDANQLGQTALIYSVVNNVSKKIIRLLLTRGSNVNQLDKSGNSALHEAVSFCNIEMLETLLQHGANVNLQNEGGYSPIHRIIESEGFQRLAKVHSLLEHQANVHLEDCFGNTPLLRACERKSTDIDLIIGLFLTYGSDVNHTNKDGMTALMIATQSHNDVAMLVLLKAKAEVNAVTESQGRAKTALSIVLNKWYPNEQSQHMALELLQHGAMVKYAMPDVIHRLIVFRNYNLMSKLINSGLCPYDVILDRKLTDWPMKTISPLSVCLMKDNLQLSKYFIKNWYLTKSDIKILSRNEKVLENLNSKTKENLKEVSTEPLRLELLSFICVSTALGSGTDREEKVKKSLLPPILQEYLLYKKVDKEALDESVDIDDDDDDDSLHFCLTLTRRQLDNINNNSEYFEEDEAFHQLYRYFEEDNSPEENTDQEIHEISVSESSEESTDQESHEISLIESSEESTDQESHEISVSVSSEESTDQEIHEISVSESSEKNTDQEIHEISVSEDLEESTDQEIYERSSIRQRR